MFDPKNLAYDLCQQAKAESIPFSKPLSEVNYPFALGYLTGTLEQALQYLTPEQRQQIAHAYLNKAA
jgi:hypothetical protein